MSIRSGSIDPCKVAIYIRWSTDDQSEGTTLDVQLEGCRHYALSQGWTVSDALTFIDDGYSGGNLDRPALTRLRAAVGSGHVDCVVVYKLDRLSRDVPDMIRLIMDEWEGYCYVKSAREPVDTTTQSGKMFFYTLASYAEWERSVIKERTFSGKLRRAQEGKNPGVVAPYGYVRDGSGFAVVPGEAEVVKRIFAMYRQGYGAYRVTAALNTEGIPFRGGGVWKQSTIKHMLRNEAYKGELVYGTRRIDSKRQSRYRVGTPHVTKQGVYPALISCEEWDLVQQIRHGRPGPHTNTSGRGYSSPHMLTGMLRCGKCGKTLGASGASDRKSLVKYRYYVCEGVVDGGPTICDSRRVKEELLDQVVADKLLELYGSQVARRSYLDRAESKMAQDEKAVRGALSEVEAALSKIEGKRKKLRTLVLEDNLTTEEYRAFVQDVEDEARSLYSRQTQLQQTMASIAAARSERVGLAETMARLDAWESLDVPQRKELLRSFVEKVEVYLPRGSEEVQVTITWRLREPLEDSAVTLVSVNKKGPGGAA